MSDERRLSSAGILTLLGTPLWLAAAWVVLASVSSAQLTLSPRFNLSEHVRVDEVDNQTLAQFRRVDELLAAGQIDEALESLDRATDEHARKLIAVEPGRYVPLATYRQMRIAAMPETSLAAYRRRIDPQAEAAYRRGIADRDERLLARVVADWFCSSWGDDAALALGELLLERGAYNAARRNWLALFETPPTAIASADFDAVRSEKGLPAADAALLDKFYRQQTAPPRDAAPIEDDQTPPAAKPTTAMTWYAASGEAWAAMTDAESAALVRIWHGRGMTGSRLAYPRTNLPLADLRARLILADLLAGDVSGAAEKLAAFRRLHPTATGKLAGQTGPLADRLATLVTQARDWPTPHNDDWTTFAADPRRTGQTAGVLAKPVALGKPAWRVALGEPLAAHVETDREVIQRQPRIGETWNGIQAYFPVVAAGRAFVAHRDGISALDAATGRPAWGTATGESATGESASGKSASAADGLLFRDDGFSLPKTNQWTRGVPRFTLTVAGDRLVARVGPSATSLPTESRAVPATARSKIVVLDVSNAGQGRLAVDPIELDDELLAVDGTPVLEGRWLYAVLRRSDVRPEVLVACYDLAVNPPRQRWRTSIAAAETPGSGQLFEITHNLLSLDGDTLYLNTNLGAVAALAADTGDVRWLHAYPRVKLGDLRRLAETGHFYRDLTPCLVHRDAAIVAPFDSPAIFALDAATGAMRWSTDTAADAIHLLGAAGDTLWASGDRLYAFDVRTGRLVGRWPEAVKAEPRGIGRGAIVGDAILWPTRHELCVFDARAKTNGAMLVPQQPPVNWARLGVTGGNLTWSNGLLLVATENELAAFVLDVASGTRATQR